MRVTRLRLANLRAIEEAEFRFQPGINLLIGVNGVGKSTVLAALSVCLSAIVKRVNPLRIPSSQFLAEDIRVGAQSLSAECSVLIGDAEYIYVIHKSWKSSEPQVQKAGMPREQVIDTPDRSQFVGASPKPGEAEQPDGRPIGVLFSTRRAMSAISGRRKTTAPPEIVAAYIDAFTLRGLGNVDFAAWMRARKVVAHERPEASQVLDAFESAIRRFLPGYSNIRTTDESQPRLLIDRGERTTVSVEELSDVERARLKEAIEWSEQWMALNWETYAHDLKMTEEELSKEYIEMKASKLEEALARLVPNCENLRFDGEDQKHQIIDRKPITLAVDQLSDGERGMLSMVLDLTRRLAQANPNMDDPAAQAEAVVLIDEIDLHLHPKWQRQIVQNLTAAFPRCQFIATTHSPQIIGEVERNRIQIITEGQVYLPSHSFGVDSSRVLEEIMDTAPRTEVVQNLLLHLSRSIGKDEYERAHEMLNELATQVGEADPEVTRTRTLLEFLESEE